MASSIFNAGTRVITDDTAAPMLYKAGQRGTVDGEVKNLVDTYGDGHLLACDWLKVEFDNGRAYYVPVIYLRMADGLFDI